MSFPRYPKYRDSGVDWLGHVPEHWKTVRLRWLSTRYAGGTPDKAHPEYWTGGTIPWLNSGAVNQSFITEPSEYISERGFENSSARWIPEGALVIALAGQGKTKGMVAQLGIRTTCNQSMAAIVPTYELNARFLYWWLTANYQNIRNLAGGDLRDGLNLELLGNIECPVPPVVEQEPIAILLDRETAKIDALVAEQQRLIELLKEKRQAVISHTVTKGLNPLAHMKASGFDWLGDVPKHWRVASVRHMVARIEQGWSPECYNHPANESEWGVLKAGCVNRGVFVDQENKALPDAFTPIPDLEVRIGDVLMSRASGSPELIGSTAYVAATRRQLMLSDKIFRIYPDPAIDAEFFTALFNSLLMRRQVERAISGAEGLANNLPQSSMKAFIGVIPPLEEQRSIVEHLAERRATFDALIAESQRSIDLLRERRTSLISAAVTGKIDVRGLVDAAEAA